ncbi:dihydroorotase [compost metagenome]
MVFDPDVAWKIEPDEFRSKTGNSPFDGKPTQGRVLGTVVGGRMVHRDEKRWPSPVVDAA